MLYHWSGKWQMFRIDEIDKEEKDMTEKRKNNKRRRILALALAFVLLVATGAFGMGMHAYAEENATLYTGGGVVLEKGFEDCGHGIYKGDGVLPKNVYMSGATFQGWYKDAAFTQSVAADGIQKVVAGASYYAKWETLQEVRPTASNRMAGAKMNKSVTAWRVAEDDTTRESMSFFNYGFFISYWKGKVPAAGGTEDYSGTQMEDFIVTGFKEIGDNIYLGITVVQEGTGLVRITYYLQNRGNEAVSDFNLAATSDADVVGNAYVPLNYVTNDNGYSYLQMLDTDMGRELRIYVEGDTINKPDRLWWGSSFAELNQNGKDFIGNAFNDGVDKKYKNPIDSALSLSWTDITVKPGATEKFSFLVGLDTPGNFAMGCNVALEDNNGQTLQSFACENGASYTLPTPEQAGYTGTISESSEACWYNTADATMYKPGEKILVTATTTLQLVIKQKTCEVSLTLKNGTEPITGKIVRLLGSTGKFTETTESGVYYAEEVRPGTYEIAVDYVYSKQKITITPEQREYEATLGSALVIPKQGDSLMRGKAVSLCGKIKEGDSYQMLWKLTETEAGYQVENIIPGTYDIRIDGTKCGIITVEPEKTVKELPYMKAAVDLKKDGVCWTNAKVTLQDPSLGLTFDMALSGGAYRAEVPEGSYQIRVNDAEVQNATLTTGDPTAELSYYTVSYYSAPDLSESYEELKQVVQSGQVAVAGTAPSDAGAVVSGWKKADGSAVAQGASLIVTEPIKLYRNLTIPQVVPGAYNKSRNNFPDLAITGYNADDMISGIQVTVTNGTVTVTDTTNDVSGSGTGKLTVFFAAPMTVTEAEAYLRALTFTLTGTEDMSIEFQAYEAIK